MCGAELLSICVSSGVCCGLSCVWRYMIDSNIHPRSLDILAYGDAHKMPWLMVRPQEVFECGVGGRDEVRGETASVAIV